MEFTTRFELQSQATRLRYTAYKCNTQETDGIVTLSDTLFQGIYSWSSTRHACHNTRRFGNMGSSRFSRPY
eukprot:NODE_4297_length_288_cov_7887.564854_g3626_i0.p3 GENE.NODE_4297_length_288_cov_7887.564854_g3626_i0~~NODE_4297_length_288_cov_7887.564854_g3626_i0.p3  ORF type:complete len:71 (-),score=8.15 NODE_4297_length_288_cov_7887.564854_g3626_i0:25-237(-)